MTLPMPRPHQLAALAALEETLVAGDRAQLLMACGAGKTLVGRWLAQRRAAATTLVVVPSLALVAQTLAEWRSAGDWTFEALITCSDPSTAAGAAERVEAELGVSLSDHLFIRPDQFVFAVKIARALETLTRDWDGLTSDARRLREHADTLDSVTALLSQVPA